MGVPPKSVEKIPSLLGWDFRAFNKGLYRDLRKKTAILCEIREIVTKLNNG